MKKRLKYIGENIRQSRLNKGLTIEQLAELADISESFLGLVERGSSGLSIETLIDIAKILEVSTDSLIIEGSTTIAADCEKKDTLTALIQSCDDNELDFLIKFIKLYRKKSIFNQSS